MPSLLYSFLMDDPRRWYLLYEKWKFENFSPPYMNNCLPFSPFIVCEKREEEAEGGGGGSHALSLNFHKQSAGGTMVKSVPALSCIMYPFDLFQVDVLHMATQVPPHTIYIISRSISPPRDFRQSRETVSETTMNNLELSGADGHMACLPACLPTNNTTHIHIYIKDIRREYKESSRIELMYRANRVANKRRQASRTLASKGTE